MLYTAFQFREKKKTLSFSIGKTKKEQGERTWSGQVSRCSIVIESERSSIDQISCRLMQSNVLLLSRKQHLHQYIENTSFVELVQFIVSSQMFKTVVLRWYGPGFINLSQDGESVLDGDSSLSQSDNILFVPTKFYVLHISNSCHPMANQCSLQK